jgi:DNA polymerase
MILGLSNRLIIVDVETFSTVELRAHGSDRYFSSKSTRTLMVSFREHGTPTTHLYQPHLHALPKMLTDAAALSSSDVMFCAFNAPFDRCALALAGIPTPTDKWLDIMLLAYILAFAGGLDDVLRQFGVRDADGCIVKKNPEGKRLITKFSKPNAAPWYDFPGEWHTFCEYCKQDTDVEVLLLTKILKTLDQPRFHPQVQTLQRQWLMDQRMNARGLPVSEATVRGALKIKAVETARILDDMKAITGLANPNSVPQLMEWCKAQGCLVPNLQAPTIRDMLAQPHVPEQVKTVLQHRLEVGKASVKKFDAIAAMQVGWRVRNGYTTAGASRTGRTASRGINLSNLERPKLKDPDWAADLIELDSVDLLEMWLYGPDAGKPVMDVLGSCVRGAIAAPEGKGITAVDLKSIESVGVAWLAGCDTILDLFWAGKDTYKDFATKHYKIPYEAVTKTQRTFCKPAVLGCLAGETAVLSRKGWVRIDSIRNDDELWDGEEWVTHQGLMIQGTMEVSSRFGIRATPDHLFLTTKGWKEWNQLTEESLVRGSSSGCGLSSATMQLSADTA